ncbi:MAG TPA: CBS domain-containing protein [Pyrinomonadaceae bacterium]|nr:CBS domain-containing protein [Pyrinomonadaceae bacterium]
MARYRNEFEDERDRDRDFYTRDRDLRMRREAPWGYDNTAERNRREFLEGNRRTEFSYGRFGERAEYDYDEPRYGDYRGDLRNQGSRDYPQDRQDRWRADDSRAYGQRRPSYTSERSRLRCRDIMTRDLAVANRITPLNEVAVMMKQEDTGVIPVVEYPATAGNGKNTAREETGYEPRTYGRGKLLGLITDRDIVIRAVCEDKDCRTTPAEEVMTTDISTARPNDRVVDVIRKMGEKQVRRIPVVGEDNRLLGMISMADVAVETEADQELGEALEDISKGSSFWRQIFG